MSDENKLALRCIDPAMIDKGLETCTKGENCRACPYWPYGGNCVNVLMQDVRAYIFQLKNGGETPATQEG